MSAEKPPENAAHLLKQLEVARTEIKNLRSQLISLKFSFRKDVEDIERQLVNGLDPRKAANTEKTEGCDCELAGWKSIGVVNTWFPGKRGVPRQAALSPEAQGVLTLSPAVINNPAYSLSGLEEFSHFWIIFHFHQTCGAHVKTKVAPPRLGGARVGLFGTRSPHRPCPIGLSLVKLDRIDGNAVHFSGVDMVDGTPVLDIKPYIPQYDDPRCLLTRPDLSLNVAGDTDTDANETLCPVEGAAGPSIALDSRHVPGEGCESPLPAPVPALSQLSLRVDPDETRIVNGWGDTEESAAGSTLGEGTSGARSQREAPDGEEGPVQIASWITSTPSQQLQVNYLDRALEQLRALPEHASLQATVTRLLEQDPRSNYLRRKLGSQFYTFRIDAFYVSVKFDDAAGTVTVTSLQQAV